MKHTIKRISLIPGLIALLMLSGFQLISPPTLFVIGDSISIQYGPYLEQFLHGRLEYSRKEDDGGAADDLGVPEGPNGGDSRMVLEYLKEQVKDPGFAPDYLLLNCGLHDIKRDAQTNDIQVSADNYKQNLQSIIDLTTKRGIQIIWMRTTAVVDTIHNTRSKQFHRYAEDHKQYNHIADQVMAANSLPVIDLYDFTWKLGVEQFMDHVHYNEQTRKLQAAYIAGYLSNYVKQ